MFTITWTACNFTCLPVKVSFLHSLPLPMFLTSNLFLCHCTDKWIFIKLSLVFLIKVSLFQWQNGIGGSMPKCSLFPSSKGWILPILDIKADCLLSTPNMFAWNLPNLQSPSLQQGDILAHVDIRCLLTCAHLSSTLTIPLLCCAAFSLWACGFALSSPPQVFTKVLVLILTLLHFTGIPIVGYLDNQPTFAVTVCTSFFWTITLTGLGWVLNLQKLKKM